MKTVEFEQLIGKTAILCAVEGYVFRLGDITFQAIEDENDGYRSSLQCLKIVDNIRPTFKETVTISRAFDLEGIQLVNELGKVVLQVGTSDYDDYYPCFVFNWFPENLSTNLDIDKLLNQVTE